jgi:hypothetical protein
MRGVLLLVREASASIRLRTRAAVSPAQIRSSADLKFNKMLIHIRSYFSKKIKNPKKNYSSAWESHAAILKLLGRINKNVRQD